MQASSTITHQRSSFSVEELDARMREVAKGDQEAEAAIKRVLPSKFWQFILMNGGLNGKLTEYFGDYRPEMVVDRDGEQIPPIDHWYFKTPIPQAYQEVVIKCRKALSSKAQRLFDGGKREMKIASIACGTLFDITRAEYPKEMKIKIYGFDTDPESLALAKRNLERQNIEGEILKKDAWEPLQEEEFDAVVCNGFTFYIQSDERLITLFKIAQRSLKFDGIFCTSFMPPMDQWDNADWKKSDPEGSALLDKLRVIPRKWHANFRSSELITQLLQRCGFSKVEIDVDRRHIHSLAIGYNRTLNYERILKVLNSRWFHDIYNENNKRQISVAAHFLYEGFSRERLEEAEEVVLNETRELIKDTFIKIIKENDKGLTSLVIPYPPFTNKDRAFTDIMINYLNNFATIKIHKQSIGPQNVNPPGSPIECFQLQITWESKEISRIVEVLSTEW